MKQWYSLFFSNPNHLKIIIFLNIFLKILRLIIIILCTNASANENTTTTHSLPSHDPYDVSSSFQPSSSLYAPFPLPPKPSENKLKLTWIGLLNLRNTRGFNSRSSSLTPFPMQLYSHIPLKFECEYPNRLPLGMPIGPIPKLYPWGQWILQCCMFPHQTPWSPTLEFLQFHSNLTRIHLDTFVSDYYYYSSGFSTTSITSTTSTSTFSSCSQQGKIYYLFYLRSQPQLWNRNTSIPFLWIGTIPQIHDSKTSK